MFKNILVGMMLVIVSANAHAEIASCNDLALMNEYQHSVLIKSYKYGNSYDLGWTLAAQAWAESSAGTDLYRPEEHSGGSHGIYQSLLDNVIYREYGMRMDGDKHPTALIAPLWLVTKVFLRVQLDQEFAAKHAILELNYWQVRTKSHWQMLSAYNGGYSGIQTNTNRKNNRAANYATKVQTMIKLLKTCKSSPLYKQK